VYGHAFQLDLTNLLIQVSELLIFHFWVRTYLMFQNVIGTSRHDNRGKRSHLMIRKFSAMELATIALVTAMSLIPLVGYEM
jgi:hypothetical protein